MLNAAGGHTPNAMHIHSLKHKRVWSLQKTDALKKLSAIAWPTELKQTALESFQVSEFPLQAEATHPSRSQIWSYS